MQKCGSLCSQIKQLKNNINNIVEPFYIEKFYKIGNKAVSDNTLYICIKPHQASPEIFIGNSKYRVVDYGGLTA